ncbi:MAG TPA: flagellar protein FlaG [Candidatus Hydrogenedentes bacterium]|nr:flagellar protein FlaG [Candidatus Hydrogenedentota bacterium]HPG65545.1 flagellar protein FlaG [Candidatus Hydrogenedentota bacterium]
MGVSGVNGLDLRALAEASVPPQTHAGPVVRKPEQEPAAARNEAAQESLETPRGGTRLSVDKPTGRIVAQIVDVNHEIIKQIPPEELLKIAAKLRDLRGVLFDLNG